jgi:nicotinic acid mononucleotide adenylyltransferase
MKTERAMTEGSDYQRTIAFMCRDFLDMVEEMPEFHRENDLLDRITAVIIDEGDKDLFHIRNLEDHMYKYETKLLAIYSRNPDNTLIDKLYRRSASLREMCTALSRSTSDCSPGEER